jgi:hypothetical protein
VTAKLDDYLITKNSKIPEINSEFIHAIQAKRSANCSHQEQELLIFIDAH